MNEIQIIGLILNLIIYIIMLTPLIIISCQKSIYETNKKFLIIFSIATIIEIILSTILFIFPKKIFSIFTNISGIINYAEYASNILFISSSLYSVKILLPFYFYKTNTLKEKKITTLISLKVVTHIIFLFIGYILFNIKGILFSFPICDLIFYTIYIKMFLDVIC